MMKFSCVNISVGWKRKRGQDTLWRRQYRRTDPHTPRLATAYQGQRASMSSSCDSANSTSGWAKLHEPHQQGDALAWIIKKSHWELSNLWHFLKASSEAQLPDRQWISDYSYPQTCEAGCWFHSGLLRHLFVALQWKICNFYQSTGKHAFNKRFERENLSHYKEIRLGL